jgi:hypothetical protein
MAISRRNRSGDVVFSYKVVCSGALPSATRPKTTISELIQIPMKMQGRRVTTRKTKIS